MTPATRPIVTVAPRRVEARKTKLVMPPVNSTRVRRTMPPSRKVIRDGLTWSRMDPIAGLLDGPRARRAFLLRCSMNPPWALHIRDEAPLSLVAMLRGRACFVLDGREPVWLGPGDVAILLGPEH